MTKDINLTIKIFIIELKSILRSKYLKFLVLHNYLMTPFILFVLYNNIAKSEYLIILSIVILLAIPVVGISAYGFSKDGLIYECFVTKDIPTKIYVQGKVVLIIVNSIIFYLCILPFIINNNQLVLYSYSAGILYYIGFGGILMLYYSSFDKVKIDINKYPFFPFQEFSLIKVILVFPITFPLFFWDITRIWGIKLMAVIGIFGLFMFKKFILLISKNLNMRKYSFLNN